MGSLVTLIAAVHYFYMREYWVIMQSSPIVYRYIDWSLTVPLQMIEFFLILQAVNPDISQMMFWRLLVGTVAMLAFGYLGETQVVNAWLGFILGLCGWGFIIYEIGLGEAASTAAKDAGESVSSAFNLIYNVADFVNKIWFCLAIWGAAKSDTRSRTGLKEPLIAAEKADA